MTPSPAPTPTPQEVFDRSSVSGVAYDEVVHTLEDEGVEKFEASWSELYDTVKGQLASAD